MNPRLQGYVPLVNFIAEVVGPNCEVVLHDWSKEYDLARNGDPTDTQSAL